MVKKHKKCATESTPSPTQPKATDKRLTSLLHRALVIFTSQFPARELFAAENEAEIQLAMEEIRKIQPELLGGALRNKALGQLWGKADRGFWESQRMELQADISMNQPEFPLLMARALQNLCDRGCLGPTVMSFSYAFRDENDGLASGTIYSGFDTTTNSAISHQLLDHDQNLDNWDHHADSLLPRKKTVEFSIHIPLGESGIPIFPHVDVTTATISQLMDVVNQYLKALWQFAWASDPTIPVIPWSDLSSNPEDYYDTKQFRLPIPLTAPELYHNPLSDTAALVSYFISLAATDQPFSFRSKEEITSRKSKRTNGGQEGRQPFSSPAIVLSLPSSTPILPPSIIIGPPCAVQGTSTGEPPLTASTTTTAATIAEEPSSAPGTVSESQSIPPVSIAPPPAASTTTMATILEVPTSPQGTTLEAHLLQQPIPAPSITLPSAASATIPAAIVEGPSSVREIASDAQLIEENGAGGHERNTKAIKTRSKKPKKVEPASESRTSTRKRKQPEPDLDKPVAPLTKKKRKTKGSWFWYNPVTDGYVDQNNKPVDKNGDRLEGN